MSWEWAVGKRGKSGVVRDGAVGGFGEADGVQGGNGSAGRCDARQDLRDPIAEVFGDVLGGGVERREGGRGVQVGVREGAEDFGEGVVEGVEVQEKSVGVERGAAEGDGEMEVVAVEGFEDAADEKGVCGAELTVHGDVEHMGRV